MTPKTRLLQDIRAFQEVLTLGGPMIKKHTVSVWLDCVIEDLEKIREAPIQNTLHEKDDCDWSRL